MIGRVPLLLLLLVPAGDDLGPLTVGGREARVAHIGSGDAGALVEEARTAPLRLRRAALEELARLAADGRSPEGALEVALHALGGDDPLERAAGIDVLQALGRPAVDALTALLAPAATEATARIAADLPSLEVHRVSDALFAIRRAAIERRFFELWTPDDGNYDGMYAALREHGAFAGRVLAAIALDRTLVGSEILETGPYRWRRPPPADRERQEVRNRALEALADAGTPQVAPLLRAHLRARPARERFDENDPDPVPATFDDEMRHTLVALGDPEPILELIRTAERLADRPNWGWTRLDAMRREASARIELGTRLTDARQRLRELVRAEALLREIMRLEEAWQIGVDGVEYYNLACLLAQRDAPGDRDRALDLLERSFETHAVSADWFARDGDLRNLHGEARFQSMVARLREREEAVRKRLGLPEDEGR